jgi:hypothetical protein
MVEPAVPPPTNIAGGDAIDEADEKEGIAKGLAHLHEHVSSRNVFFKQEL